MIDLPQLLVRNVSKPKDCFRELVESFVGWKILLNNLRGEIPSIFPSCVPDNVLLASRCSAKPVSAALHTIAKGQCVVMNTNDRPPRLFNCLDSRLRGAAGCDEHLGSHE